jgi:autotransporter-associated beta strand protein
VGTLVVASGTNLVTTPNKGQNAPGLRVSGGTMLVAGGVVKTTNLMFVNVDGGHLLVTNGLVDTTSCYEILNSIGNTNNGYTTVSGSGVIVANALRISQSGGNPSNSVVSVSTGGVMRLNNFYIDVNFSGQKGMLFLNGGTVEARRTETNFLGTTASFVGNSNDRWLTNIFVHVREGGAIFNTLGYSVGVKQPLLSGAPADGGLTKRGTGRLILFNTNTFNGATSVEAGTLELGRSDALPAANTVNVSSNAVLDVGGKAQTLAGIGGSGTVVNPAGLSVTNSVAPGDAGSFGTLTFAAAPAALAGTLSVNVSTNGACDRLHVAGDLNLAALSLSVEDTSQLAKYKRYTVATCTGTLTTPFASVGPLPARWLVKCDAADKQAYLVYDFGTLINVR